MSVYKEPINWLCQSIDSILQQTYSEFEFIIVCDNPESQEIKNKLKDYEAKDKRMTIIWNEQNIGLTKSLNKALRIAKGAYIARMDADDIAYSTRFEKQMAFIAKGAKFVYADLDYIDEEGKTTSGVKTKGDFSSFDFFVFNPIAHPTVLFDRSLLELRKPLYNEACRRSQDYELWTMFFVNGVNFTKVRESLLHYRVSKSQISNQNYAEQRKDFENMRENLIKKHLATQNFRVDAKKDIALQLPELYQQLRERLKVTSNDDALFAIYYLVAYSIAPSFKRIIIDYFARGYFIRYSVRKTIYMSLRTFNLKLVPFYKIKSYIV